MFIALKILLNILIFTAAMFATSLVIEKCYGSRLKWGMTLVLTIIIGFFLLNPGFLHSFLNALLLNFSAKHLGMILLGGIFSGICISFF